MELPHNRGHSGDRGPIECLPAAVLDSEVKEHIGGRETSFWDKRAVEQGLVIDSLGLPGNEPEWIFRRGWCHLRGGAGLLLLAGIDFHGAMVVDLGLRVYKKKKNKQTNKRGRGKGGQMSWGEKLNAIGYLKTKKIVPTTLRGRAVLTVRNSGL